MITYPNAIRSPEAFLNVFGYSVEDFNTLYTEFSAVHTLQRAQSILTRKGATPRKRKPGAGRRFKHSLRDRLLLTLFWLKVNPTLELLGFFFSLDKTSAEDNLKDVLETLGTLRFALPDESAGCHRKLHTLEQALEVFPDVALMLKGDESRPTAQDSW